MRNLFSLVLNMSMTGSIVILLVILARLLLKRFPKIFSYALWSVVLFRLLCPVAFTAPVSVLEAFGPEVREASPSTSTVSYLPARREQEQPLSFVPPENPSENLPQQAEPVRYREPDVMQAASRVWIAGAAAMLLYSAGQYIHLRRRLIGAVVYRGNVYLADYLDTAFVMGIFRPKIYLPSNLPAEEQTYIIAHERHHIRRFDHILKLLAYFALCVHWFNPLVWAAFILSGKDMEMSCDEAVIKRLGAQIRADYSASLLRLATHKKIISGMPLAFGEGDTKGRIENMAKWRKPKLWVSIICMVLCAAILAACAVNPEKVGQLGDPNSDGPAATFPISEMGYTSLDSTPMDGPLSAILKDFHFALPEGLSLQSVEIPHTGNAGDSGFAFSVGDTTVGGLALRYQTQPNDPGSFTREWQTEIGVPEASDDTLGYMGGSSEYADYEITYFPDLPMDGEEQKAYVRDNEVTHYFFLSGTDVYDLWFYINRVPNITQENFLKFCYIDGVTDIAAMQSALNEEKEALEQCRRVLEQIQGSDVFKIETRQYNGDFALNDISLITSWGSGENRMHLALIPESGGSSTHGGLLVGGVRYECDSRREWREISWWDWEDPWLTSFRWDDAVISYQGTMTEENGTSVMLRIDQPYSIAGYEQPYYFVNFNFSEDGAFRNVYLQVDVFTDYALTRTESIVSLDSETVNAEIRQEYELALG